ncbi:hypothetical protein IZU99_09230 [Oscillospiraceae bacterium CM]|nr:hypothetical protein IZU99_09230 [Oscillospiraceae bacterium CM]
MKKFIILALVIICICFTGCNNTTNQNNTQSSDQAHTSTTEYHDVALAAETPATSANVTIKQPVEETPSFNSCDSVEPSATNSQEGNSEDDIKNNETQIVGEFWNNLNKMRNVSFLENYNKLSEITVNLIGVSSENFDFEGWMKCGMKGYAEAKYSKYIELFNCTWEISAMVSDNTIRLVSFGTTEYPASDIRRLNTLFNDLYGGISYLGYGWLTESSTGKYVFINLSNDYYYYSNSSEYKGYYNNNDNIYLCFERCYV